MTLRRRDDCSRIPSTDSLEVAELEAVFRILEVEVSGSRASAASTLERALDRFLRVYEVVNTATHSGVEEAKAKLKKK